MQTEVIGTIKGLLPFTANFVKGESFKTISPAWFTRFFVVVAGVCVLALLCCDPCPEKTGHSA